MATVSTARQRSSASDRATRAPTIERLDADLLARARRSLARRDARLAAVMRRVGPCPLAPRGDPYGFLLRSVVYQQLAGAAARAIHDRFLGHFGGRRPEPARLLATPEHALRGTGLSRSKIAALRGLAEACESGVLRPRQLFRLPDGEVVEQLTRLRGIGPWTAHMTLMFSLGRPDVLPVGDYGVRKGAQHVYGLAELPGPAELESLATCWRPYASVASWYLWRALE